MTRTIRPWQLFAKLPPNYHDITYRIPSEPGVVSETISSLDTLLMVSAVRIFKPKTLLEWGTGLGYNAHHMCSNTDLAVTTVDREHRPFMYAPTFKHRVEQVIADVKNFRPYRHYDMIFYDVNIPGLTEHCTKVSLANNPRIMAWHDYGNPQVPHVKRYIDSLPLDIIHVEDSQMAFWFRDGFEV